MQKLKGVNLGGWLVLERWMTPLLFEGLEAQDEYSFCRELGDRANQKLEKHWRTFITKKDFVWIKKQGLNTVRIPVSYWNFEDDPPFISSIKFLDQAMNWAKETGLMVIIDLHAAPGSQNGWDHSGRSGEVNWHKSADNIERTLVVLEKIAAKYGPHPNIAGIELLNEPHWDIPLTKLKKFYQDGYVNVRKHTKTTVIFHDSFRPKKWQNFLQKNNFQNVIFDLHLYQCFSDSDKKLSLSGHLKKTEHEWKKLIHQLQKDSPTIIGEWSLGLDPKTFEGMNKSEIIKGKKNYAKSQIETFNEAEGWFFWNYKVENPPMIPDWSYKDLVKDGILD